MIERAAGLRGVQGTESEVESAGRRIRTALDAVPDLAIASTQRDELWVALWTTITTRGVAWVTPAGSTARVRVTADDADAELIAAWEWLIANVDTARGMGAALLHRTLRGVATGSHRGSARSAMADSMGGLTRVPGGTWIELGEHSDIERLAS